MKRREALKLSAGFMGATLSGLVFSNMLQGCEVNTKDDWQPQVMSPEQSELLASFSDHLLPRTSSPSASEVYTHRFIDDLVTKVYDEEGKIYFTAGLDSISAYAKKTFGKPFTALSSEQKDSIFEHYEAETYAPDFYLWGNKMAEGQSKPFYRDLKGLILFGYFSSEEVGENVLNYNPIPGRFVGCMPLEEVV